MVSLYAPLPLFSSPSICQLTKVSSGLGNVIGTFLFPLKDAPNYLPGKAAVLALFVIIIPLMFYIRWLAQSMNKKKAIALAAMAKENGWSEEDIKKEADKAAVSPFLSQISLNIFTADQIGNGLDE